MHWWEARLTTVIHCNGITNKQIQRLQGIQNTLCRIVTRTHRFSNVTGPLMSLHWLPVKYRVQFKVCLMTYKVYKNTYPAYLEDCVQLTGAYIILGTANLLVTCWPFRIMTINGTNPLNIYLMVISIHPHDYGTHFLRLVDVLLLSSFRAHLKTYL